MRAWVKLQINELGSWRNICELQQTAEHEEAAINAVRCLQNVVPDHVRFSLLYPDGYRDIITTQAEA